MPTKQSKPSICKRKTVADVEEYWQKRTAEQEKAAEQVKLHQEETQRATAVQIFTSLQTLTTQLLVQSVNGKVSLEMVGWASNLLQQADSTHKLWMHANAPTTPSPST